MLHTLDDSRNLLFKVFHTKKLKKEEKEKKLRQNLEKTCLFNFAPKRWSRFLFPEKNRAYLNRNNSLISRITYINSSMNQDSNPQPPWYEADSIPMCYRVSVTSSFLLFLLKAIPTVSCPPVSLSRPVSGFKKCNSPANESGTKSKVSNNLSGIRLDQRLQILLFWDQVCSLKKSNFSTSSCYKLK